MCRSFATTSNWSSRRRVRTRNGSALLLAHLMHLVSEIQQALLLFTLYNTTTQTLLSEKPTAFENERESTTIREKKRRNASDLCFFLVVCTRLNLDLILVARAAGERKTQSLERLFALIVWLSLLLPSQLLT